MNGLGAGFVAVLQHGRKGLLRPFAPMKNDDGQTFPIVNEKVAVPGLSIV
jgi:hypothetical protein